MFFVTFLPGFVPAGYPIGWVSLGLGGVYLLLTGVYFAVLIGAASQLGSWLATPSIRRRIDRLTGVVWSRSASGWRWSRERRPVEGGTGSRGIDGGLEAVLLNRHHHARLELLQLRVWAVLNPATTAGTISVIALEIRAGRPSQAGDRER